MDSLLKQIKTELSIAERYQRTHKSRWEKNKNAYQGKVKPVKSRSNIPLGQTHGYVETFLSKIDNDLMFKYNFISEADKEKARKRNAYVKAIAERDEWSKKGRLNNKYLAIYGTQVYFYFAKQVEGVLEHSLVPIAPERFYIDPQAGQDIDSARYMGHYGIRLTRSELQEGEYIEEAVNKILQADGDKFRDGTRNQTVSKDVFFFYAWFTYIDDEPHYVLYHKESKQIIKKQTLKEAQGHDMFPYWHASMYPDLDEFYTKSFVDILRPLVEIQHININMMIDNAMRVSSPQRLVRAGALKDPRRIQRFVPNDVITVSQSFQANDIQTLEVPSIQTPLQVYQNADQIIQLNTGITSADKGLAEEEKVGIYEGNQANTADRYGLLDKNRADGWKRFAKLFDLAISNNITAKDSIKMMGPSGAVVEDIKLKDLESTVGFDVSIDATLADDMMDVRERRQKIEFLNSLRGAEFLDQKELSRKIGQLSGLSQDEIRSIFDSQAGNSRDADLAIADIDAILRGKAPRVAISYGPGYLVRLQEYLANEAIDLSQKQYDAIKAHADEVLAIAQQNMPAVGQGIIGANLN